MSTPDVAPARRRGEPDTILWRRAVSWALYDFANTIYSAIVVSWAVTLHVKEFTGVEKYTFLTMALSQAASGVLLPVAGELTDRTGRAKRCLLVLTLLACGACAAISAAPSAWLILCLFALANFCYNASLTFYDCLLPTLAPRERMGLVSGLGVSLGYVGVAVALPIGILARSIYARAGHPHELTPVFAVAGVLFLVFSLPLFLWVPEKPASKRTRPGTPLVRLAFRRVFVTLRLLPRHKPVLLFLLGNFLCVDALNTGIVAYAPYVVNVFGLDKAQAAKWMIPFTLCAAALGFLGGKLADVFGGRKTMLSAGICVAAALVIGAVAHSFAVFMVSFVLLGGYGLSTIWVAGRKLLVELVPAGQVGKYFGLYNVGHKLSMIGAVVFGITADMHIGSLPAGGYRLGLLLQLFLLSTGLMCIYQVRQPAEAPSG